MFGIGKLKCCLVLAALLASSMANEVHQQYEPDAAPQENSLSLANKVLKEAKPASAIEFEESKPLATEAELQHQERLQRLEELRKKVTSVLAQKAETSAQTKPAPKVEALNVEKTLESNANEMAAENVAEIKEENAVKTTESAQKTLTKLTISGDAMHQTVVIIKESPNYELQSEDNEMKPESQLVEKPREAHVNAEGYANDANEDKTAKAEAEVAEENAVEKQEEGVVKTAQPAQAKHNSVVSINDSSNNELETQDDESKPETELVQKPHVTHVNAEAFEVEADKAEADVTAESAVEKEEENVVKTVEPAQTKLTIGGDSTHNTVVVIKESANHELQSQSTETKSESQLAQKPHAAPVNVETNEVEADTAEAELAEENAVEKEEEGVVKTAQPAQAKHNTVVIIKESANQELQSQSTETKSESQLAQKPHATPVNAETNEVEADTAEAELAEENAVEKEEENIVKTVEPAKPAQAKHNTVVIIKESANQELESQSNEIKPDSQLVQKPHATPVNAETNRPKLLAVAETEEPKELLVEKKAPISNAKEPAKLEQNLHIEALKRPSAHNEAKIPVKAGSKLEEHTAVNQEQLNAQKEKIYAEKAKIDKELKKLEAAENNLKSKEEIVPVGIENPFLKKQAEEKQIAAKDSKSKEDFDEIEVTIKRVKKDEETEAEAEAENTETENTEAEKPESVDMVEQMKELVSKKHNAEKLPVVAEEKLIVFSLNQQNKPTLENAHDIVGIAKEVPPKDKIFAACAYGFEYLPHPLNCNRFVYCNDGAPLEMFCAKGFYWNAIEEFCDTRSDYCFNAPNEEFSTAQDIQ